LFWHGKVVQAKLPANSGLDAAAISNAKFIRYV
jgi:hypothetical protein